MTTMPPNVGTVHAQTVMCDEEQKNMTVEMNKEQKIKEQKPAHTVAEVVLHTRKTNPHHNSHSSANLTVMFQEIQSSYLYGKIHPFPLELIRWISGKQHGRSNPRLVTNWGIFQPDKFIKMKFDKFKSVIIGVMVLGVLSLNFVNPLSHSSGFDDVNGIATQLPISSSTSQSEVAAIPTVAVAFVAFVLLHNSARTATRQHISVNNDVFDGIQNVGTKALALSRLD